MHTLLRLSTICLVVTACGPAEPPEPDGCAPAGTWSTSLLPSTKSCTMGDATHPSFSINDFEAKEGAVCGQRSSDITNAFSGTCVVRKATLSLRATATRLTDGKLVVDQQCPDYECTFTYSAFFSKR